MRTKTYSSVWGLHSRMAVLFLIPLFGLTQVSPLIAAEESKAPECLMVGPFADRATGWRSHSFVSIWQFVKTYVPLWKCRLYDLAHERT